MEQGNTGFRSPGRSPALITQLIAKATFKAGLQSGGSIRGDLIFLLGVLFSLRDSIEYQLHPARYTKLFVDSKQMVLDGMLAHAKFG